MRTAQSLYLGAPSASSMWAPAIVEQTPAAG